MNRRCVLRKLGVLHALLVIGACSPAPSTGFEGAWEVAAILGSVAANEDPEPGQAVFTSSRYSLLWILPDTSMRAFQRRWTPTDAEKIQRYDEIVVNAGAYEIRDDSTMVLRPTVSRVPEFMRGGYLVYRYKLVTDTLWFTSIDEYSFDGVQAPWAAAGNRVTLKLRRLREIQGS